MASSLQARVAKAFRVRGTGVRQVYYEARRVGRFFRDARRREVLSGLRASDLPIPRGAGFLVVPPGRFEETVGIVEEARAALSRFDAQMPPEGKNRKRFLQNVLNPAALTLDSPVVKFALRNDILSAVSQYLGVVPFLSTITVFHSDTVEGAPTSSQLYHCDGDDVTQVKIFVYCSDVDPPSGPLTILDATTTHEVQRITKYQFRQRLTDQQVTDAVPTAAARPVLGPAGTAVFVDTSRCFHFGSRVARDAPPRLVTMIQYQTPYSFMLPGSQGLPFRRLLAPGVGDLQRLVLGE
jgi:hypothetical protein